MVFASKGGVRNKVRLNERIHTGLAARIMRALRPHLGCNAPGAATKCGQPWVLSYRSYIASSGVRTGIEIASISTSAPCAPCALLEVSIVNVPRLSGATW